ncbi:MAG: ribose 5-phosphate isomerase B [Leptospiraceae bacterium]|nr:ribose 5-phosphate isomerase B [Leptospiraceae bacterium]MDW8305500.1 ribose 5-phosphate isomerase B [Leptospiraceae bacterium]
MELKVGIASDHGGFELKEAIKAHFGNITWVDLGTHSTDSVDYPDIAQSLCQSLLAGNFERGIAICGTGIGISIACNRFRGIRAALCYDAHTAEMARRHNNANILALGGRTTPVEKAFLLIDIFLKTPFDGGRHEKRIQKLDIISP